MHHLMVVLIVALVFLSCLIPAYAGTDKTLVSWVHLDNTTQQGGSALTVQVGDQFDGIVFGEKAAGKWMAGSNMWYRTQADQAPNPVELASPDELIQIAVVYEGRQIRIYRNGELTTQYEAENIDLLGSADKMAVFGLRHWNSSTGQHLQGSIEDARVYNQALTVDEIKALEPDKVSLIKPYGWWTFEKGQETDRMNHFPVNNLRGGAKISGGCLELHTPTAAMVAASYDFRAVVTPKMPANPDPSWLSYHLAHPGPGSANPGDPNCAFFWKGQYHLHYIYALGGFCFAHVSSTDLVHWRWHKTTLTPEFTGHGMFSGTGFFTKEGKPAIIYHGQGSGRNQIAIAQDDQLEQWSKPVALEPVIRSDQDGSQIANWDPDAWVDNGSYYALSGGTPGSGKPPTLFKSADMKSWNYLGLFLDHEMPDVESNEDVSCPNFFKIGNKHMLLCISHTKGCRYYLGEWKNEKFIPDFHARMNWHGLDFFAPESVQTPDGRRVMWAWCVLPSVQTGVQSLPRELSLPRDGVLRIKPLRELKMLRYDEQHEENITVNDSTQMLRKIGGNTIELNLTIESGSAAEYGIQVYCDAGGHGLPVTVKPATGTIVVGDTEAPFVLKKGESTKLRIFLDKSMVEVFANDRQAVVYMQQYKPEDVGISLFSHGGPIAVKRITAWKMRSIYEATSK